MWNLDIQKTFKKLKIKFIFFKTILCFILSVSSQLFPLFPVMRISWHCEVPQHEKLSCHSTTACPTWNFKFDSNKKVTARESHEIAMWYLQFSPSPSHTLFAREPLVVSVRIYNRMHILVLSTAVECCILLRKSANNNCAHIMRSQKKIAQKFRFACVENFLSCVKKVKSVMPCMQRNLMHFFATLNSHTHFQSISTLTYCSWKTGFFTTATKRAASAA